MTQPESVDLAVRLITALKPLAERADNRTLLALSDLVLETRDPEDLMSVIRLFTSEYPDDAIAGKIHFPRE
jgi:hypothetical protein